MMMGEEENFSNVIENTNDILPKTFFWMFLGLLGTAIVSFYTYASGLFATVLMNGYFGPLLIFVLISKIASYYCRNFIFLICCH